MRIEVGQLVAPKYRLRRALSEGGTSPVRVSPRKESDLVNACAY